MGYSWDKGHLSSARPEVATLVDVPFLSFLERLLICANLGQDSLISLGLRPDVLGPVSSYIWLLHLPLLLPARSLPSHIPQSVFSLVLQMDVSANEMDF